MPFLIRPFHLQILHEVSQGRASKLYRSIKDALGKKKHQEISINEYADYIGINKEEIKTQLSET